MIRRFALSGIGGLVLAVLSAASVPAGAGEASSAPARSEMAGPSPSDVKGMPGGMRPGGGPATKFQDFHELTKDTKTHEGFFTLHEKDQHLYAEIKPQQLEQPILAPMMIARGSANAGQPLNFGDEWVLAFRRVGDKLQLLRKNIHFTAPAGTPSRRRSSRTIRIRC